MSKKTSIRAFSFLELSLVILIIGVLISAFLGATDLSADAKLRHAKTLTQSSPVLGITKLALWFDATSDQSFLTSEAVDGALVSRWNNLNPSASDTIYLSNNPATANDNPSYRESCINGLPCLYFGVDPVTLVGADLMTLSKSLGLRTKSVSVFVVFTGAENANNGSYYRLLNSDVNASIQKAGSISNQDRGQFFLDGFPGGYFTDYFFMPQPFSGVPRQASCDDNCILNPKQTYLYVMVDDGADVNSVAQYLNGTQLGTSNISGIASSLKSLGVVEIGAVFSRDSYESYQGNIGEIMIFAKALSSAERKSVEQYLSKKWGIKTS